MLGENTNTTKRNTKALLQARREVGRKMNTERTIYMVMTCHQTSGQNHNLPIANKSFENDGEFKYLGRKVTNQNCNHEESKRSLN
jgi:hypothetical protein